MQFKFHFLVLLLLLICGFSNLVASKGATGCLTLTFIDGYYNIMKAVYGHNQLRVFPQFVGKELTLPNIVDVLEPREGLCSVAGPSSTRSYEEVAKDLLKADYGDYFKPSVLNTDYKGRSMQPYEKFLVHSQANLDAAKAELGSKIPDETAKMFKETEHVSRIIKQIRRIEFNHWLCNDLAQVPKKKGFGLSKEAIATKQIINPFDGKPWNQLKISDTLENAGILSKPDKRKQFMRYIDNYGSKDSGIRFSGPAESHYKALTLWSEINKSCK